jgi:hypothetical protein
MFAISTKVKLAAGIAAGALALGAAGAYAAQNLPQTITNPTISTLGGNGAPQLNLVSLNGAKQLSNPKSLPANPGECVSFFATNRNYALVPAGYDVTATPLAPITIPKANYHGKLMSGLNAWCKAEIKAVSTPTTTTTTTNETVTTDTTQSNDTQSGAANGHGHAYGRSKNGK